MRELPGRKHSHAPQAFRRDCLRDTPPRNCDIGDGRIFSAPDTTLVSCGHRPERPCVRKSLTIKSLQRRNAAARLKSLISLALRTWLAALDDVRNWLRLGPEAREKT